jgi:hypothetical protein
MRSALHEVARPQDERHPDDAATNVNLRGAKSLEACPTSVLDTQPLWQLDIAELTGHNLEARGREEVNRLLADGWQLLHIYTLKYREDGVWRERPMAILGRPRHLISDSGGAHESSSTNHVSQHPLVGSR